MHPEQASCLSWISPTATPSTGERNVYLNQLLWTRTTGRSLSKVLHELLGPTLSWQKLQTSMNSNVIGSKLPRSILNHWVNTTSKLQKQTVSTWIRHGHTSIFTQTTNSWTNWSTRSTWVCTGVRTHFSPITRTLSRCWGCWRWRCRRWRCRGMQTKLSTSDQPEQTHVFVRLHHSRSMASQSWFRQSRNQWCLRPRCRWGHSCNSWGCWCWHFSQNWISCWRRRCWRLRRSMCGDRRQSPTCSNCQPWSIICHTFGWSLWLRSRLGHWHNWRRSSWCRGSWYSFRSDATSSDIVSSHLIHCPLTTWSLRLDRSPNWSLQLSQIGLSKPGSSFLCWRILWRLRPHNIWPWSWSCTCNSTCGGGGCMTWGGVPGLDLCKRGEPSMVLEAQMEAKAISCELSQVHLHPKKT